MKFRSLKKLSKHKLERTYDRSAKIAYRLPVLWQLVDAKTQEERDAAHAELKERMHELVEMGESIVLHKFPRKMKKELKQRISDTYNAYFLIPAMANILQDEENNNPAQ